VKVLPDAFRLKMALTFFLVRHAIALDPRSCRASGQACDLEAHAKAKAAIATHMADLGFRSAKMLPETM
jgi:hypothetical protein